MNAKQMIFLRNVVPAAIAAQRAYGIPASITIAQAIFESSWGESALASKANNYFGIKATANATPDEYAEFMTTEFVDGRKVQEMAKFAKYASPADSFAAHSRLLSVAPRYASAMAVKNDPAAFAAAIQKDGYSTDPIYGTKLMQAVTDYDLTQYDTAPNTSTS